MQLLHRALAQHDSAEHWAQQLGMSKSALGVAKHRGRLSPTTAGNLARLLGEPVEHWIAVAALEAEPNTYGRRKLQTMLETALKS